MNRNNLPHQLAAPRHAKAGLLVIVAILACLVVYLFVVNQAQRRHAEMQAVELEMALRSRPSAPLQQRVEKPPKPASVSKAEPVSNSESVSDAEGEPAPLIEALGIELRQLRFKVARYQALEYLHALSALDPTNAQEREPRMEKLQARMHLTLGMVPELELLSLVDWLEACKEPLVTDMDYRRAMSQVRTKAEQKLTRDLEQALQRFLEKNPGQFPTNVAQLAPLFYPPVLPSLLARWKVVSSNEVPRFRKFGAKFITLTRPDPELDPIWVLGDKMNGFFHP